MANFKQIECVSPFKKGLDVIALLEQKGIFTANRSSSKGTSGFADPIEMEVLTVLVEESQAEEIFDFLYEVLNIGKPHHGMIYQSSIKKMSDYRLPTEAEIEKQIALAKSDKQ